MHIKYNKFYQMAILSFFFLLLFAFLYRKLLSNIGFLFFIFVDFVFFRFFLQKKKNEKKKDIQPIFKFILITYTTEHTQHIILDKTHVRFCYTHINVTYNLKIILHGRTLLKFKHVFTILFDLDKRK